jgi:hypothetical protein
MIALRRTFVVVLALSVSFGVASFAVRASGFPGSAQIQAPGRPYSGECSVVLPQAERLEKGLGVQRDAIARTEAQIAAAKGATSPAPTVPVVDSTKSLIMGLLEEKAALRTKLEKLKLSADAEASRTRIFSYLDKIGDASTVVDVLLAGGKFNQAWAEAKNIGQMAEATGTYLMDSGLADALAGELGKRALGGAIGGPAGALIVQAAALGIEVGAHLTEQEINANDLRQAESTRDALKYQLSAIEDRISFMKDNCAPDSQSQSKPSAKPSSPPEPPAQNSGKRQKTSSTQATKGGPSAGKIVAATVIAGGATVGALYAAQAVQNATTTSSTKCDPSKAPINEINYYCFGSTRNTSMCNQYISQYDSFCKSCGFSRFDVNQGGCR